MKNIKKLLSIVMVLALVLSLGASVLADGPAESTPVPSEDVRTDVTINEKDGKSTGGTYEAYKLLNLTTTADATEDSSGYSYTVNSKYSAVLQTAAGVTSDEAVLKYLDNLRESKNEAGIRAFADALYKAIKAAGLPTDVTAKGNKFEGLEQGYYMIVETKAAADNEGVSVVSQVMLETAGRQNVTVTTKEEKPESHKKVQDVNDSDATVDKADNWQDSADYDIDDAVPFQLTGTLPADIEAYDSYEVIFHDIQSKGLNAPTITSVTINGVETKNYTTEVIPAEGDTCTFHVKVTVKGEGLGTDLKGGELVVVNYTSVLNENAEIGSTGNPNEMFMEYTNDHYGTGTGTTPKDKVIVFTYDLDVNKVDENGKPLTGAEFALYKQVAVAEGSEPPAGAFQLTTDGEKVTDENADKDKMEGWYVDARPLTKNDDGTIFTSKGLDDGNYVLVETKVPDGYNAIAPKSFTVSATHNVESDDPKLTGVTGTEGFSFTLTPDASKAMGQTNIVNQTGLELPETGGIGTTIFYVVGAILVAGAVILLVTRKRMSGADK